MHNTREEKDRFAAALKRVAILTAKGEKPDSFVAREYWIALNDFNIDTIEEVADRLIQVEATLISLPPPGRWRQVANELFELRPRQAKRPGDRVACEPCGDSGYRIRYDARGVRFAIRCECRDGGIAIDESTPPDFKQRAASMYDLEGEIGPPADGTETELARRRREHGNRMLHCMCCGAPYRLRQGRRCICRTPPGMSTEQWIRLGHAGCPNPLDGAEGKGNARCRNHCGCTPEQRSQARPKFFPTPAEGQHVDAFLKEHGLREPDAPGPAEVEEPPVGDPPIDIPYEGYDPELGF